MRDGRPLIGPSGRIFNQLLQCANIDRRDVLVTNVFDIQAPDNEIERWTVSRKEAEAKGWREDDIVFGERYFDPKFVRPQLYRLHQEIKKSGARIVVPMGSAAVWAFTGINSAQATRGSAMLAKRVSPGLKILPTFHPAFVMRTWKMFHVVVSDIMKADAQADFPGLRYTERQIWIEPTLADIRNFRRLHLDKSDLISIDIETARKWRQITCVGFASDANRALVIPFTDWRKPNRSYWRSTDEELEAWRHVEEICASPTPKLLQNGPYDVFWLWDRMRIPVLNYSEDTRLLHHALYPEMPKDLGFMGASYADQGPWKLMRGQGTSDKKDE